MATSIYINSKLQLNEILNKMKTIIKQNPSISFQLHFLYYECTSQGVKYYENLDLILEDDINQICKKIIDSIVPQLTYSDYHHILLSLESKIETKHDLFYQINNLFSYIPNNLIIVQQFNMIQELKDNLIMKQYKNVMEEIKYLPPIQNIFPGGTYFREAEKDFYINIKC